jgi:hypothetical protein
MSDNNKVMKALSQEDLTVIGNIKSLLDELVQQGGGMEIEAAKVDPEVAPVIEEPKMDEAKKANNPEEKESKAEKGVIETPADAATGSSPAVDRINEVLPEETSSNVDTLARAISKALIGAGIKPVQKAESNPLVSVIQALAESQKATNNKVDTVAKAFDQLCEAFGINEQIEIAQKAALPEKNRKPIVSTDNDEVIKYLANILNTVQKGGDNVGGTPLTGPLSSNAQHVRKNLMNPTMYSHLLGDLELSGGNE